MKRGALCNERIQEKKRKKNKRESGFEKNSDSLFAFRDSYETFIFPITWFRRVQTF